jgi:hypothetical protein
VHRGTSGAYASKANKPRFFLSSAPTWAIGLRAPRIDQNPCVAQYPIVSEWKSAYLLVGHTRNRRSICSGVPRYCSRHRLVLTQDFDIRPTREMRNCMNFVLKSSPALRLAGDDKSAPRIIGSLHDILESRSQVSAKCHTLLPSHYLLYSSA